MNIKLKILLISGLMFLIGCSSVENKIIDTAIYTEDGKAYSVLDDKTVSGVIQKEGYYGGKEFYTYRDGKISNLKKVDRDQKLIYSTSFDNMGLKDGILLEGDGKTTAYSHGVLDGEKTSSYRGNKVVERYSDGVLNGIQEKNGGIKEFYTNGVRTTEDLNIAIKKQSKNVVWGEIPEKNFTGKLYGTAKKDMKKNYYEVSQIEEYKDGVLLSRSYYDKKGIKLEEFYFVDGDIKKVARTIKYRAGVLLELKNYNLSGDLNGSTIIYSYYPKYTETKNYIDGILHGKVERLVTKNNKICKEVGVYDKGIYSGAKGEQNYRKGVEVDEKLNYLPFSKLVITNKKDVENKLTFTGYTREDLSKEIVTQGDLYYYENGTLKEKYEYSNNSLVQQEDYRKDGRSTKTTYKDGLVVRKSNYNAKGIENGQVVSYEHSDSKTVSYVVDGVIDGRSIHYHGGKIFYIDEYDNGKTYKRTIYYDYDKRQIKETSQGVSTDTLWVLTGLTKSYYENGKLEKVIDYGDKLVATKKIGVTEYYQDGKIKSKGQMDYCSCLNYGEKTEYYENGQKKIEENFNKKGRRDGIFKAYNKEGKLIKEINYKDGYLR
uniref:Uncharacterized protein n=1 Tax=Hirondellea gigas TaxID=1518452 RepID=A0A6A7FXV6_9CRUS